MYKENIYHSIFNNIKDCVAIYEVIDGGKDFKFVGLNPAAQKTENLKESDVIGKKVTELFPAVVEFGIFDAFKNVYRTGVMKNFPLSFYKDGRIQGWRENDIYKIDNKHIIAVYNDVTKAKQAEVELQLAAQVFENSLEGMVITNSKTEIIKVNRAFIKMSGYDQDEILGSRTNILKSNMHPDSFYKDMWACISNSGEWQGEIWNRKKSGELFAVFLNISAIKDPNGKIKSYIAMHIDITEKKKTQEHLNRLANYDILTGLYNRINFEKKLNEKISSNFQNKKSFALLFINLDNFKYINDSFGHKNGDHLLVKIANKLKEQINDKCIIARLGGDEFAIIIDDIAHNEEVGLLSQQILNTFDGYYEVAEMEIQLGCCIGVSIYPSDGETKDILLRNANIAMHNAKQNGKNRFSFHQLSMNEFVTKRLLLDKYLREAIKENQFKVFYQPKLSLKTNKLHGAEALIRWNHHILGFVSPLEFITYAEGNGLIIPIGEYVLKTVCQKIYYLEQNNIDITIAVNISSIQLSEPNFVDKVKEILFASKCNANRLEFEITESKVMTNVQENIIKLNEIKKLGIKISIDDFGTGYSSMSYLQKLPANTLKIDKSFIDTCCKDANENLVINGILSLSKALQLETIAEGVELMEQKIYLEQNGCDIIQGYLYSKPLNEDDFISFINNNS